MKSWTAQEIVLQTEGIFSHKNYFLLHQSILVEKSWKQILIDLSSLDHRMPWWEGVFPLYPSYPSEGGNLLLWTGYFCLKSQTREEWEGSSGSSLAGPSWQTTRMLLLCCGRESREARKQNRPVSLLTHRNDNISRPVQWHFPFIVLGPFLFLSLDKNLNADLVCT